MEKIELNGKSVLVTGSAGFIGSNLVLRLFKEMQKGVVVGLDNMNDYYDVALKEYRLEQLKVESEKLKVNYQFRHVSDGKPPVYYRTLSCCSAYRHPG